MKTTKRLECIRFAKEMGLDISRKTPVVSYEKSGRAWLYVADDWDQLHAFFRSAVDANQCGQPFPWQ